MHATGCAGRIRMQATREGDQIIVRVVDPCPALDAGQLARRLDAFLSPRPMHIARTKGLSVSVALLRIFGATMKLERGGAEGTTMRIELPAAEAPPQESRSPASSRAPRARVLLVDDDVLVRIGLRRLLGREYSIVEAGSVGEAIACIREQPDAIDAIVCDLVMPDGGAKGLLDELARTAPELVRATVLMTGGAVDDDTRMLLEAHAGRVLHKPIAVDEVRSLIQRVRRRPVEGLATPFTPSGPGADEARRR
jgi:CheY-like chemotaxis protein